MKTLKTADGSMKPGERAVGDPRGAAAEALAKELAFEAMKRLVRFGGDTSRLSELGLAALEWAGATDERDSYLARGRPGRDGRFVRDTDHRVWVTKPILKARGWTDAAIRDFLPEPEGRKPNPRFTEYGAPMSVWLPETVAEAENLPKWQEWLEGSLHRRNTTVPVLAATSDDQFRARLAAVQEAIEGYLRVKATKERERSGGEEVVAE